MDLLAIAEDPQESDVQPTQEVLCDDEESDNDFRLGSIDHELGEFPAETKPDSSTVELDPSIYHSRKHAMIQWQAFSGYYALIIYGRNGAKVNDTEYFPNATVPLYDG